MAYITLAAPALNDVKKEIKIKEDGTFELELDYPLKKRHAWFRFDEFYFGELLLTKDVMITIDLAGLKSSEKQYFANKNIKYSGTDGAWTTYANEFTSFLQAKGAENPLNIINKTRRDKTLSTAEKTAQYEQHLQTILNTIEEFDRQYSSEYSTYMKTDYTSDIYSIMAANYWYRKIPAPLFSRLINHEPDYLSNNGLTYFRNLAKQIKYGNPETFIDLLKNNLLPNIEDNNEKQRMNSIVQLHQAKLNGEDYDKDLYSQERKYLYKTYGSDIRTAQIHNFHQFVTQLNLDEEKESLLLAAAGERDIERQTAFFKILVPKIKTKWVADYISNELNKLEVGLKQMEKELAESQPANKKSTMGTVVGQLENGAELYHAEHETITSLLKAIHDQHPDKAIIIDLWAVWCSPCIQDMKTPRTAVNYRKLQEMDVELIYLCSSNKSSLETWKKQISKMDMAPAQHIYLSDKLSLDIMREFNLNGFPSHLFFNKAGQYKSGIVHRISHIDLEKVKANVQ